LTRLFPIVVGKSLARLLTWSWTKVKIGRVYKSAPLFVSACAAVTFGLLPFWLSVKAQDDGLANEMPRIKPLERVAALGFPLSARSKHRRKANRPCRAEVIVPGL
jgi:hypothetical protein